MVFWVMMLLGFLVLSAPALAGISVARSGNEVCVKRWRVGLLIYGMVLLVAWAAAFFIGYAGFAISGGNTAIYQLLALAFIMSSPFLLAAIFNLFAARILKGKLSR